VVAGRAGVRPWPTTGNLGNIDQTSLLYESAGLRGDRFSAPLNPRVSANTKRLVIQAGRASGSAPQQLVDAMELLAESFCILSV
jgi:hypothetical protein